MSKYNVDYVDGILKIGFGDEVANNNEIIVEAMQKASLLRSAVAGKLLRISGPVSCPIAMAIGHEFAHLVPAVACFDPKLGGYVVCISHSPKFEVGQIIPSEG